VLVGIVAVMAIVNVAWWQPYQVLAFNQLLGGTAAGARTFFMGWGEGLDQAARFLNSQPGDEPPRVMLGLWSGTFSYFFAGTIHWSDFSPGETTVQQWRDSDYCIIYINQWQRGRLPQELIDYLAAKDPALVVQLQGLDYAYVYNLNDIPPPAYLFAEQETGIETNTASE
jgi:hypothetical protein